MAKRPSTSTILLNQNATEWYIYSGVNTTGLQQLTSTSWGFDFPIIPGKIGYVLHRHTAPIIQSKLRISCKILCSDPAPIFDFKTEESNTGTTPSNFRFLLWKNNKDSGELSRWWSNPSCVFLAPGEFILEVDLTPDKWSSVYGKFGNLDSTTLAGFNACKQGIGDIGVTFGGGSAFGHGVRLLDNTGWAKFNCLEFKLI